MILLILLDVFLLSIVMLWSGDEVRRLRIMASPLRMAMFFILAVLSAGWIARNVEGHPIQWWALALHAVLAVVALFFFGTHHPYERHSNGRMGRQPPRRHC